MDTRYSDEVPSFLEARAPLIQNPFMRPRPVKGINLLEKFEEVSDNEEPDLVQVFLRMKPCKIPNSLYELRSEKCLVTSLDTTTAGHGRRTQCNVPKMYTFSRIFSSESTQKEVFERVVKANMKRLIDGYSFTLLTYGASGSGKTYTLMGTVKSPGLVPRALEYLFKLVDAAQTPSYKPSENGSDLLSSIQQDSELQWVKRLLKISAPFHDKYRRMSAQLLCDEAVSSTDLTNRKKHYIWVSFVEIYNEAVYDLLAPPEKRTKLRLREDSTGNVYVKGVTQTFVRSGSEAYDVMVAGKHNLVVAETGIHAHSSRSHCIFTITMLTENDGEIRSSHIRFCDLAGCERQSSARNTGARMQESKAINSSLHVLERCLHMLRKKQHTKDSTMVPYRECKLTRILGSGLSGSRGEAVTMVVTVNPAPQYAHETRHVLSLALVAKDIQVNSTIDPTVTTSSLEYTQESSVQDYHDEIQRLRAENERLHFELVQAQSCITHLRTAMVEKQQEAAATMSELVEETRDMMKQYYEKQLSTLRSNMREMEEEYEERIEHLELMNKKLARELKDLEERQGKVPESIQEIDENEEDEIQNEMPTYMIDSDDVSETEANLNESLEPINQLRKSIVLKDTPSDDVSETETDPDESLEQVKQIRESILLKDRPSDDVSETETDPDESLEPVKQIRESILLKDTPSDDVSEIETDLDESLEPVKQLRKSILLKDTPEKHKPVIDSIHELSEEESEIELDNDMATDLTAESPIITNEDSENDLADGLKTNITMPVLKTKDSIDLDTDDQKNKDNSAYTDTEKDKSECELTVNISTILDKTQETSKDTIPSLRGTYFIRNEPQGENNADLNPKALNIFRGTYYVPNREMSFYKEKYIDDEKRNESDIKTNENKESPTTKNKESVTKLAELKKVPETLVSKIMKSFKNRQSSVSSLKQFEQLELAVDNIDNTTDAVKSFEIEMPSKIKKKHFFDDTFKETIEVIEHNEERNCGTGDSEKLKFCEYKSVENSLLSDVAKTQEKKLLFDSPELSCMSTEKLNDSENLGTNNTKLLKPTPQEIKETQVFFTEKDKIVQKDVLISKSPSVLRNSTDEYLPSVAGKKLLVESFTKPEILSSTRKDRLANKHDSLDIFESPLSSITKASSEGITKTSSEEDNIKETANKIEEPKKQIAKAGEIMHELIESLVVSQKMKAYIEKERTFAMDAKILVNKKNTMETNPEENEMAGASSQDGIEIAANINQEVKEMAGASNDKESEIATNIIQEGNDKSKDTNKENEINKKTAKEVTKIKHEDITLERTTLPEIKIEEITLERTSFAETTAPVEKRHHNKEDMSTGGQQLNDTESTKGDNTVDEFEKIVKDLTNVRATDFDLLLTQEEITLPINNNPMQDLVDTTDTKSKEKTDINKRKKDEETKYNLRNREKSNINKDRNDKDAEQTAESSRKRTCRSLRLRRRRNDENVVQDDKMKDIVNLKMEFSDVTMGLPAAQKHVQDIPSPEKVAGEEENIPPVIGIQTCPAKSVTRSRRKLFTPRAEPLEESPSQAGDSNERLYIPRPSYHRPRARRKL